MRDKRIPRGVRMRHSQGETEELLAAALPLLTEILRFLRVRHGLSVEEAEDFGSLLKIKLLDNDRSVLRAYRGDSSLRTYLAAVANRLFLDQRVSVWGRWRPSAKARRLGPLAVELEELVRRERRPLGDAIEVMAARHAGKVSRGAIDSLAGDLRLSVERTGRTPTGPDAGTAGDSPLARLEREELGGKVGAALRSAYEELSIEDRLIVRMHFQDGLTLAAVSRALGLDQKLLYRRVEVLLDSLRSRLENAGIRGATVADLLGRPDVDLGFHLQTDSSENPDARPSNPGEP